MTNVFSRLAGKLFGATADSSDDTIDSAVLEDAIDAIVDAVDPRIRALPRYRKRLAPTATRTIRFMRSLAPALLVPIELSRTAWSAVPAVNALFPTADAVPAALGRSDDLRKFFKTPNVDTAYALLAMRREERNVLASALIDGEVRRDVAQTTVGFADHVLIAIADDAQSSRRLVGEAILERLAALALERIVAARDEASALDTKKSLLTTRLRVLTLKRGKLHNLATDEPDPALDIAKIERELAAMADEHREVKANLATLDYSIEQIDAILGNPAQHLGLDTVDMRINRMGYKLDDRSAERGTELHLKELWIGPHLRAVIVPVVIRRAEFPPERDRFGDAARGLR
jgi:hypothetical protein